LWSGAIDTASGYIAYTQHWDTRLRVISAIRVDRLYQPDTQAAHSMTKKLQKIYNDALIYIY